MPVLPRELLRGELADAGYKNVESLAWNGLFMPTGTPDAVVARINAEMDQVAEGVNATAVVMELARDLGVDLPICAEMDAVVVHSEHGARRLDWSHELARQRTRRREGGSRARRHA